MPRLVMEHARVKEMAVQGAGRVLCMLVLHGREGSFGRVGRARRRPVEGGLGRHRAGALGPPAVCEECDVPAVLQISWCPEVCGMGCVARGWVRPFGEVANVAWRGRW